MDRRNFLRMLGLGAATVAAPKFIFDMGANLWRQEQAHVFYPTDEDIARLFIKEWQERVAPHYESVSPLWAKIRATHFVSIGNTVTVPIPYEKYIPTRP